MFDSEIVRRRTAAAINEVSRMVGEEIAPSTRSLELSLDEPITVAVVGRVSSGKSTLVNALLGEEVAPTTASETTQIIGQYRFGRPKRISAVLKSGEEQDVPFTDGKVPNEVNALDHDQVARLDIYLPYKPLQDLSVLDTPGTETTTEGTAERAIGAFQRRDDDGTELAIRWADVVLYTFTEAWKSSDSDTLALFRQAGWPSTATNTLALLTKADLIGKGPAGGVDPLPNAAMKAVDTYLEHETEVASVLPVSAKLASSSRSGRIDNRTAYTLSRLTEVTPQALARIYSTGRVDPEIPVEPGELRQAFDALGLYGVVFGRDAATQGVMELQAWASDVSGIKKLEETIRREFAPFAPLLRSKRILEVLRGVAYSSRPLRASVLGVVERAEADEALAAVALMDALSRLIATKHSPPLLKEAMGSLLRGQKLEAAVVGKVESLEVTSAVPVVSTAVTAFRRAYAISRGQPVS